MAPSSCNYYNISEENMQVILDGTGNITEIQVVKENIFFLNWILRRIPSWPAAASGVTMTPSSKTLLSPRTIGFVALLTMWPTCTRLESLGLSWEPSSSGAFPSFLISFLLPNPLSVPLPTSTDGRRASTSGLSPWCSSPSSRSLSTTATTCSPCSRWQRWSRTGAEPFSRFSPPLACCPSSSLPWTSSVRSVT